MLLINFKNSESAVGKKGLKLAKTINQVAQKTKKIEIGIAINPLELALICQAYPKLTVFLQHSDEFGFGSHTGSINPFLAKKLGATGVLLNHSEKRLGKRLQACVETAQAARLKVIVCAANVAEVQKITSLKPNFIAVEPPDLIGGKVSVTTANPAIIQKSVAKVRPCKLLVGAGIKKQTDVATALKLGAHGVLLASGVTNAKNPQKVLNELAAGFPQ